MTLDIGEMSMTLIPFRKSMNLVDFTEVKE